MKHLMRSISENRRLKQFSLNPVIGQVMGATYRAINETSDQLPGERKTSLADHSDWKYIRFQTATMHSHLFYHRAAHHQLSCRRPAERSPPASSAQTCSGSSSSSSSSHHSTCEVAGVPHGTVRFTGVGQQCVARGEQ